ncbi:MAG: family 1 glycosylhydrolase [Firmicutes bacterium]|nr:family 1 glycosylhydrolase [Bacillota bacterium]
MEQFPKTFLKGAATAAHQVEGGNIHSDYWMQEHLPHSSFAEPSGAADDHYHRYKEDMQLLRDAGANAYRFSMEWARIEPEKGCFDENEIAHYLQMIRDCRMLGLEPVVTLMHFTSPAWLIKEGGWENPKVVEYFADYVRHVAAILRHNVRYVCTINEANMRLQLLELMKNYRLGSSADAAVKTTQAGAPGKESQVQVGLNLNSNLVLGMKEAAEAFGIRDPRKIATFVSPATPDGDRIVMEAHRAAVQILKETDPEIQAGLTLSLHDIQACPGGEQEAARQWDEEFTHYLPWIAGDDFLGVQNYTRKCVHAGGVCEPDHPREKTQMGYEIYPEALEHVIRKVAEDFKGTILVTENGIATDRDEQRCDFIRSAAEGVQNCMLDGIPVKGYFYWSLLDNFEWQKGFSMTFGLIAVDREHDLTRHPKPSLQVLGEL